MPDIEEVIDEAYVLLLCERELLPMNLPICYFA